MKKWAIGFVLALSTMLAFAQTPAAPTAGTAHRLGLTAPANCSTASGFPCIDLTWTTASCAATVTNNAQGMETTGPCGSAVLRCTGTGSACGTSTLPAQTTIPVVGNSTWTVVTQSLTQTTPAGEYFDNSNLLYGSTYNWVVVSWYSGSGGGPVSAYSNFSQTTFGSAPKASTATPSNLTGTQVN